MGAKIYDFQQARRLAAIGNAIQAEVLLSRFARLQYAAGEIGGHALDEARCATIELLSQLGALLALEELAELFQQGQAE